MRRARCKGAPPPPVCPNWRAQPSLCPRQLPPRQEPMRHRTAVAPGRTPLLRRMRRNRLSWPKRRASKQLKRQLRVLALLAPAYAAPTHCRVVCYTAHSRALSDSCTSDAALQTDRFRWSASSGSRRKQAVVALMCAMGLSEHTDRASDSIKFCTPHDRAGAAIGNRLQGRTNMRTSGNIGLIDDEEAPGSAHFRGRNGARRPRLVLLQAETVCTISAFALLY